ncbi:MAG: threonylcarbamoyl-AMP synthase [Delftia sp.]|nr:threonylcarbamoyl-AMP synthase [Delftia sp.]
MSATQEEHVARAVALLQAGELIALPTDTVYGVAAIANRPSAVARIYVAKGRPPERAIPLLLAHPRDLDAVTEEVSVLVRRLVAHFWPGGLTLIVAKSNAVPLEVSFKPTVAVRVPDLPLARQIIAAVGAPVAVTSANRSGQPDARTASEALAQLGGRIAAVVDGGPSPGGVPSTILDCTLAPPRVLRVGAIPIETLRQFTPLD